MFDLKVAQDVPDFAMLWLPPFPSKSATNSGLVPFHMWNQPGIHISKDNGKADSQDFLSSRPIGHDAGSRPLVDISQDHSSEAKASRQNDRLVKRLAEGGALVRIRVEDCLKIGEEQSGWKEPEGTANEGVSHVDASPFERLISATRDFLYSRDEEFQYHRSRRLFNIIRDSFGLRSDRKGDHWPGGASPQDLLPERETCCLLRNTDNAVRGFLALARREAEAGWNSEPSIKLCQLLAAFLTYVVHHKVFPEEPFASRFERAASLGRTAPRLLVDSIRVEDALAKPKGWNAATWTLWGGQYGDAGRGSLHIDSWPVDSGMKQDAGLQTVDGGWAVETGPSRDTPADQEPSMCSKPISLADLADGITVEPYMKSLLNPTAIDEVKLLEYIPYARRRITEVLFPTPAVGKPAYLSQLCCVMTVPSPWTEAEGWRRSPLAGADHEDEALPDADVGPLELEEATMEDPSRLAIWIERSALGDDSTGHSLVGMALRGRWGLFGIESGEEGDHWWAFRSKDYILPALWSVEQARSTASSQAE